MKIKASELFKQQCYINGEWRSAHSGATFAVHNPSNGTLIGHVPEMGAKETHEAIEAASKALPAWREKTGKERGLILRRWYDLIMKHVDDLAAIMTTEQGKPLAESQGEVRYGASFIEWYAEEAKRIYGDIIPPVMKDQRLLVIKQPVGVVAAITPWNFPHAMITRKCGPALAVGCTIVLKPAEATPYSALALAELAHQAGIPPGVINIVTGNPTHIGPEMTSNPKVRKLTFTGSTKVGKMLMTQSAPTMKKLSLELGGSAPFIIFADADIESAVQGLILSKFRNSGQTCVCADRVFVEDKIYDAFTHSLVQAAKALKVGDGFEPGTQQGPLINQAAIDKVESHVKDALAKGATLACGGKHHSAGKLFYEPTVLTHVNNSMQIMREETFGPVAPVMRFKTEEEAIQLANDTDYGLASYFYGRDIDRLWRVAERLDYGMVSINGGLFTNEVTPFGGIKESGTGREGSKYGVADYLELKYICITSKPHHPK
ncbi:MAG: NAD-dependent succinate-semialdehyde dehydrogenase [Verrucomicrobia bacterium]|nr:NAD-dependent succinate-semialdehyde dehydrogenase [Verrucomicrobiota bacterium]